MQKVGCLTFGPARTERDRQSHGPSTGAVITHGNTDGDDEGSTSVNVRMRLAWLPT